MDMDLENILRYSPVIMAVVVFLIQQKLVVTPAQLERKHREILQDAEEKFATLQELRDLKLNFADMKCKIDKIYEMLVVRD